MCASDARTKLTARLGTACLQQSKRPTVEQLEMVPQVRRYARDACLAVRECQLNHNYAVKLRALRQREDELARRAKDLDAKAARLAGKPASWRLLAARPLALAMRVFACTD